MRTHRRKTGHIDLPPALGRVQSTQKKSHRSKEIHFPERIPDAQTRYDHHNRAQRQRHASIQHHRPVPFRKPVAGLRPGAPPAPAGHLGMVLRDEKPIGVVRMSAKGRRPALAPRPNPHLPLPGHAEAGIRCTKKIPPNIRFGGIFVFFHSSVVPSSCGGFSCRGERRRSIHWLTIR